MKIAEMHVDDPPGEEVEHGAGPARDEIPVDDDILVNVYRTHVLYVAKQVVVDDDASIADCLNFGRRRRDQPHTVADNAFQNVRPSEYALQKLGHRWQLRDVLGVAEPIRHHPGGNDDRGELPEVVVADPFETFVADERRPQLVSLELDRRLTP